MEGNPSGSGGGEGPYSRLEFNPFEVLGVSSSTSKKELRKTYHKRMLKTHPDKVKGKEDLATRLTQAYNLLKDADDKRKKELEKIYEEVGQQTGSGCLDNLSHVIDDKTLEEEYRRTFLAHVEVGKSTRLKDNFQWFYQEVFKLVETPDFDCLSRDTYHCDVCEDEFVSEEDHFARVFGPYLHFLFYDAQEFPSLDESEQDEETEGDAQLQCLLYLKGLFGEDVSGISALFSNLCCLSGLKA